MIDLTGHTPFGSGANRDCYRHPDNPDRCLKVLQPGAIQARAAEQTLLKKLLGRRRLSDNFQEQRAYGQSAIRRLSAAREDQLLWQHLPRFHGCTETSLGVANDCELILDSKGHPAPTLERWLGKRGLDQPAREAAERLCQWLRTTGILTRNLLPQNLVITDRTGQWELIIVDGLGAPTIPDRLAVMPWWRRRYMDRRIRRFWLRLEWEASGRTTDWKQAGKL